MPRKFKFDLQWEQALSLLSNDEAVEARSVIENYRSTGEVPVGLMPKFQMILLLVQPIIDRRRRASAAARARRQAKAAEKPVDKAAQTADTPVAPQPEASFPQSETSIPQPRASAAKPEKEPAVAPSAAARRVPDNGPALANLIRQLQLHKQKAATMRRKNNLQNHSRSHNFAATKRNT